MVSLGCPKNLVDSEKMLGLLAEQGVLPVDPDSVADGGVDAMIINTCGFLEASKRESIGEIEQAIAFKKQGLLKRVVVAGCLVQRHKAKILEWCPEVDAMIGVFDRDRIDLAVRGHLAPGDAAAGSDAAADLPVYSSIAGSASLARRAREDVSLMQVSDANAGYHEDETARLRLTPRHYAYLRLSEGCNQQCAFCTIPSIRGRMRSKPVDRILAEARELLADGAYELSLIGQDTTSYGEDLGYPGGLSGVLRELNDVAAEHGGAWLRLMYAYPSCFTDEMIDTIAALPHVLPYIDMPLQHIADPMLDAMRRKTSRKLIETLLDKLRTRIPGMAIRTTFISGFPGETEDHHRELVDFINDFEFEHMGVFPYSPEPGTRAFKLHRDDAIDAEVVQARIDELMQTQQAVVLRRNDARLDAAEELPVLIDRAELDDQGQVMHYAGRTRRQSPEIDSLTYVVSASELAAGEVVRCRMTGFDGYDSIAQPVADLDRTVSLTVV